MPKGDLVLMTPHDEAIDVTTPRMPIHARTHTYTHTHALTDTPMHAQIRLTKIRLAGLYT